MSYKRLITVSGEKMEEILPISIDSEREINKIKSYREYDYKSVRSMVSQGLGIIEEIKMLNSEIKSALYHLEQHPYAVTVDKYKELFDRTKLLESLWLPFYKKLDETVDQETTKTEQKKYYNQNRIHFEIKNELHELNKKFDTIISLFQQHDVSAAKKGMKKRSKKRSLKRSICKSK